MFKLFWLCGQIRANVFIKEEKEVLLVIDPVRVISLLYKQNKI